MNTLLRWTIVGILWLLALWGSGGSVVAQLPETPPEATEIEDSSRIDIVFINKLKERTASEGIFRELTGDVHLRQQEMHLWCDTGYINPNKQVEAFGNVQMLQDDSIRIFSDILYYDGLLRQAKLRQNVVLTDSNMTMFTEKLDYDLNTRIATFPEESLIESDSSTLVSKRGRYDTRTSEAYFHDSVRITNPNYKLTADSLAFNTRTEVATFLGATTVYNKDKLVYCEDGYYDSRNNYALLYQNARFENREDGKEEIATGDTIIYDGSIDRYYLIGNAHFENEDQQVDADTIVMDGKTEQYYFRGNPNFSSRDSSSNQTIQALSSDYDEVNQVMLFRGEVRVTQDAQIITADSLDYSTETKNSLARGHVVWVDTAANVKITAGRAIYQDSSQYLLADRDPMLTTLVDNDTLWMRADTLISLPDTTAEDARNLYAFHHVRVFKSDMQARCDSLFYDGVDSIFHLFEKPVLWVDETQFTADTILLYLKRSKLDLVWLYNNSLMVSTQEDTFFNQIKGKDSKTQFVDGKVSTMDLYQQGETVYYATDEEGAYMFVNDIDCEDMRLFFGDDQIERILYKGSPKAVVHPMHQVNHNDLMLQGFQWLDSLRIRSKYQLWGVPEPEIIETLNPEPSIDSLFRDSFFMNSPPLPDSSNQDSTVTSRKNKTDVAPKKKSKKKNIFAKRRERMPKANKRRKKKAILLAPEPETDTLPSGNKKKSRKLLIQTSPSDSSSTDGS